MIPTRSMPLAFGAVVTALCLAGATHAAEPVAIVQEIAAANAGVAFMDYVSAGDTIALKSGERLVLGYFASCVEETVTGGTVIVGRSESRVSGGAVQRHKVECDGGGLALTAQQAAHSGVVVFRKGGSAAAPNERAQIRLFGLSPIVHTGTAGMLVINRVDAPAPAVEIEASAGATDLAKRDIALAPGGIYRAELNTPADIRTVVFEIDAFARPGNGPIVSRLLRM